MASEALIDAIVTQKWADPFADSLQKTIRELFAGDAGREIKNLLHGVWLGHPVHPALTDVPIGAWTAALALDAIEGISGRDDLRAGADAAIAIGLAGAVASAITGLTDWAEVYGGERATKVGLAHGVLNLAAAGLYTASLFMRRNRSTRQQGIGLSMLGYAVASFAAYLGGHLTFGEQVGVDHTATANAAEPSDYTRVARLADLEEGKATRADAKGVAVLLVRRGDRVFAITETCPHLGGPLSEGTLEGDVIRCPWHNSAFSIEDGRVINGPATFPARCFDVRITDGNVEVRARNKQAIE